MIEINVSYALNQIPYISYEALDEYAEVIISDYAPERLIIPAPIDVLDFIENYLGLDIVYYDLCYGSKVIGFTAFQDGFIRVFDKRTSLNGIVPVHAGTVIIDKSLNGKRNIRRFRFTGMHEGSHWLLHKKAFEKNNSFGNIGAFDIKYLAAKMGRTDYSRSKLDTTDQDRMERQADFLAAALLMPLSALRIAYCTFFKGIGERPRVIFRSRNPKDDNMIKQLVKYISDTFNVSNRAALIRLEKLNAVIDRGVGIYAVT